MSKWAVYLLCFSQPIEGQQHYVGITTPDRVSKRLIEHRTGRGAKLTKAACEQGVHWFHTQTFETCCRSLERTLQRYANVTELCPRCHGGLDFPPQIPLPQHPGDAERAWPSLNRRP